MGFRQTTIELLLTRIRASEDVWDSSLVLLVNPNDPGGIIESNEKFQYYDRKFLKQRNGYWYFKDKRLNVYASIDFAYSLSKRADNSAIVVIGMDSEGHVYILDISVFKTDRISEYFREISQLHSKWQFLKPGPK